MRTLNLGILAHVDAGKTTLTERLLYAAGVIDEIGTVDRGTTRTDSLALEKKRGITIKSALVSFVTGGVTVNLIDTPSGVQQSGGQPLHRPDTACHDLAEADLLDVGQPLLEGGEGAAFEQVGRVHGVPAVAQLFDERDDAGGQPLRVVEERYLGHRNPSQEEGTLCYPGPPTGGGMVIEAVPERIDIKTEVFGDLDRLAEPDAILCSNSSSIPTSQMIGNVEHPERVLNTHYQQPPELNAVELMSCGKTDEGVIEALMEKIPQYGLVPFWVRRESDGFIFNRIWAAIKRECLMVVEEGVASPEDVDAMWEIFTRAGVPPFRLMDRVGLDVVLAIEEHYAAVREGIPEGPRKLLRDYTDQERLGVKSGGGFYDYPS